MLYENIKKLVEYGIQTGLTPECERIYTTNLLLELFQEDSYEDVEIDSSSIELEAVLEGLLDEAVKRGIIEDSIGFRDLFDTKIMNCLVPRPAQVQKTFAEKYEESPEAATEYFYKLSQDSNYIRRYRVKKDMKWKVDSPYGKIDITINLSKPEKDPKAIAEQEMQRIPHIRNVCFVWKMKDMQDVLTIRQEKTTGLYQSRLQVENGDSSIHHMCTITSIASYLTDSISR